MDFRPSADVVGAYAKATTAPQGYRIPGVRPVKPEHFAASGFEKDTALIFRPARGCDGPYDAYIFENNPKTLVTKKRYPKGTNAWKVGQLLTTGETYKWYVEGCGKQSSEYVFEARARPLPTPSPTPSCSATGCKICLVDGKCRSGGVYKTKDKCESKNGQWCGAGGGGQGPTPDPTPKPTPGSSPNACGACTACLVAGNCKKGFAAKTAANCASKQGLWCGDGGAPPPPPTPEPTPAPTNACASWCKDNPKGWDEKCTWVKNCGSCAPCLATPAPTPHPTPHPTPAPTAAPTPKPTPKQTTGACAAACGTKKGCAFSDGSCKNSKNMKKKTFCANAGGTFCKGKGKGKGGEKKVQGTFRGVRASGKGKGKGKG